MLQWHLSTLVLGGCMFEKAQEKRVFLQPPTTSLSDSDLFEHLNHVPHNESGSSRQRGNLQKHEKVTCLESSSPTFKDFRCRISQKQTFIRRFLFQESGQETEPRWSVVSLTLNFERVLECGERSLSFVGRGLMEICLPKPLSWLVCLGLQGPTIRNMTCLPVLFPPPLSVNPATIGMVRPQLRLVFPALAKLSWPDRPDLPCQKDVYLLTVPWRAHSLLYERVSLVRSEIVFTPSDIGTKHGGQTGQAAQPRPAAEVSEGADLGLDSSLAMSVWHDPG